MKESVPYLMIFLVIFTLSTFPLKTADIEKDQSDVKPPHIHSIASYQEILPSTVNSSLTYSNSSLIINSTIDITSTGELTLDNCSVFIKGSSEKTDGVQEFLLRVLRGGKLVIVNSTIIADLRYRFLFENGSTGSVDGSEFYYKGFDRSDLVLQLKTTNLSITASTFRNSSVQVHETNINVSGCHFNNANIQVEGQLEHDYESRATITDNTFNYGAINVHLSTENVIKYNKITKGTINLQFADNNTIVYNNVSRETVDIASGISLWESDNNKILHNNVSFHDGNGIRVAYYSRLNIIQSNIIHNNHGHGILVEDAKDVVIRDNIIYFNAKGPISVERSSGIVFSNNTDNFGITIKYSPPESPFLLVLGVAGGLVAAVVIIFLFLRRKVK